LITKANDQQPQQKIRGMMIAKSGVSAAGLVLRPSNRPGAAFGRRSFDSPKGAADMRSSRLVVLGSLVLAPLVVAQERIQTEAQQDGLAGRVKSVATIVERRNIEWQQPGGPTLLFPVMCHDCEYSPEGYRTRSGEMVEGKFLGQNMTLRRDGTGHVTEVVGTDAASGDVFRRAVMGPFGKTQETFYRDGKVVLQNIFRYDANGRVIDWISLDGEGAQTDRLLTTWGKTDLTERKTWGKEQQLRSLEIVDPAANEERFTTFDESGVVAVSWTYRHGQAPSYWAASDAPNQPGAGFADLDDKANPISFDCHRGGACDVSKVHYEYANAAKQNPASAEWRDTRGNLLYGAYYTYQFDEHGNWTHREVSVWSAKLGARTVYETDDRLIAYWE